MHNRQHLFVMDLVVPFCIREAFDIKPIRWNNPSSCCCDRMAPMAKLDASHSRWKRLGLEGKVSMGAEVMAFFNALKACCSAELLPGMMVPVPFQVRLHPDPQAGKA